MNRETATQLVGFIARFGNEKPLQSLSESLTMAPYNYKEAISDFINFCYTEDLINEDCYAINDELNANRNNSVWFSNLDEHQVLQCIGLIIRQDRFVDGLINQTIEDRTMLRLLKRIKMLYGL